MIVSKNHQNGLIDYYPSSQSELVIIESYNPLMPLTLHLQAMCFSAWTPKFVIKQYMKDIPLGVYLGYKIPCSPVCVLKYIPSPWFYPYIRYPPVEACRPVNPAEQGLKVHFPVFSVCC